MLKFSRCLIAAAMACGLFGVFTSFAASTAVERPEGLVDLTSPDASKVTTTSTGDWLVGPGTAFHDDGTYTDLSKRVLKSATKCNIIYTFDTATSVNAYGIKMFENGNDNRTPGAWTFYGSNTFDPSTKTESDETWVQLDARSGELDWTKEGEYRYYEFENSTAYTSYKMDFTGTSGASDYIQFSYMEYFYHNTAMPYLGDCALTKVEDGRFSLAGVLTKNDATAIKIVLSTTGQEDVVKTLGAATEGVPFKFEVTSDGLLTDAFYKVAVIAENASGTTPPQMMSGSFFFGVTPKVADFKKKIDFALSAESQAALDAGAVDGVPVVVRVSTDIEGFDYADMNVNGTDVIFGAVDESEITRYSYELEKWDPNGESVFWVKVPSLSAATTISMCYGNNVSVPDNDPTSVWSDYVGVWHMAGGAGNETDATGHGLDGVPTGSKLTEMYSDSNAPVGLGRVNQTSAGKYNRLSVPNYNEFITDHSRFTVSGWFKSTNATGYPRPLSRKTAYDQNSGWEIQYNKGSKTQCDMRGSSDTQVTMDGPDVTADWVYLTYVFNGATGAAYANGEQKKSGSIAAVVTRTDPMAIGNNANGTEQGWCGSYDEVRMYNGAQDASRVKADYLAMTPGFLVASAAEPVDATAPVFLTPNTTVSAQGEVTVTITVVEGSGSVYVDMDGEKTKIGDIDTEGTFPQVFVAHPTIVADKDVLISAYGINANGTEVYKKAACGTMNAAVVVTNTRDAKEDGLFPGIFTVSRPGTAMAQDLIVNLAWSGTAEAGIDYENNLPATVTIPAGETAVTVEVTPIFNKAKAFDTTVICTVTEGPYIAGGTATLTIKNVELDDRFNTWVGGGADDKASTAKNWSLGVPVNGQAILFDGRFANPSNKNCDWDIATDTVASWTQNNGYDGTITLRTVYPGKTGMEVLTVTGAMTIESGTLTHPQSRTMGDKQAATWDWISDLKANETYRIRVACDSFNLGAAARVDVATKGYYASHDGARCNASHGGTTQKDAAVYGDPKEPIHIGMAHRVAGNYYNGKGGGAIYITVTGAAVVDGVISADSGNTGYGAGAAGSVYLKAASVTGAGSITAIGSGTGEGNYKGTGGRIAIITDTPVNRATFAKISAETEWKNAQNGQASHFGGCGTVFFKDKDHVSGILVVAGKSDWPALSWSNRNRVTPVGTEGDWTFDAVELGRGGTLAVLPDTEIHLPGGLTSVSSTSDNAGCNGIKYEGGTLDLGSNANQTMSGKWMLFAPSNCVINANVTVQGGAMIGVPEYGNVTEEGSVLPEFLSCSVTVNGDLTIASDGLMKAEKCGFRKGANNTEKGLVGYHSHGGRTLAYGKTLRLHYQGYDSVFNPCLPGCTVPHTGGQGAGNAGGVLNCTVTGALTVDGTISANGSLGGGAVTHNDNAGPGGAVLLKVGTLSGSGVIQADGGYNGGNSSGGGGRVAVRLTKSGATFDDFTGRIVASGRYSQTAAYASHSSSAGSVYLETAADGEKGGVIRIAQGLNYAQNVLNTNTTELVSLGYGGDDVADYKKVKVEVRDYGFAAVNTDVKVKSVTLATADAKLDLEGNTLTADTFRYPDADGKLKKLKPGTYTLDQLKTLGIERVCDSVGGGRLVIRGTGMVLLVR